MWCEIIRPRCALINRISALMLAEAPPPFGLWSLFPPYAIDIAFQHLQPNGRGQIFSLRGPVNHLHKLRTPTLRFLAITLSAFQKGYSKLTLVCRQLIVTVRLVILPISRIPAASQPAKHHRFARRIELRLGN